jgi:hypothetical protein
MSKDHLGKINTKKKNLLMKFMDSFIGFIRKTDIKEKESNSENVKNEDSKL